MEDKRVDETFATDEKVAAEKGADVLHSKVFINQQLMNDAVDGENREHEMSMLAAMKQYPWACFWGFVMCFTIVSLFPRILGFVLVQVFESRKFALFADTTDSHQVMESFDMFLNGNFIAVDAFKERYGVLVEGEGWTIETKWQSALFQSGQCGAFVGVFLAGPITNRIGYRWTTIVGLILMNATIFVSFFVSSPA